MKHRLWVFVALAALWSAPGVIAASDVEDVARMKASLSSAFPVVTAAASSGSKKSSGDRRTISPAMRARCPKSCSNVGIDSTEWFVYNSLTRLSVCNTTMLLDFALYNDLDDPNTRVKIAACTADLDSDDAVLSESSEPCQTLDVNRKNITASVKLASSGLSSSVPVANAIAALDQLHAYFAVSDATCNSTVKYAYSGDVAVGVYLGSALENQNVISPVIEKLSNQIQARGSISENLAIQLCEDLSSRYGMGIFINTKAELANVQLAVQSWANSTCIKSLDEVSPTWESLTISVPSRLGSNSTSIPAITSTTNNNSTKSDIGKKVLKSRDDTCTTVQVVSGDSCATLAAECGITATEFYEYNTASDLCSTLAVGQYVCCSEGELPDNSPQPDADGYCYSYLVQSGDSCSALAATYDLTVDEINSYNNDTWGWMGCDDLLANEYICLSTGYPPMPATIANAVCGPQVNNTAAVDPGTDLSTLNECPLNACCDIWGQCGITDEFCTITNSTTGAPGTAANGTNGCISNCGTTIIVSSAPAEYFSIGYFEGYDQSRPCMNELIGEVEPSEYTHIHLAFATFLTDYSINTTLLGGQLVNFAETASYKKIVSFGGWDFSTSPLTYQIFRDAVASEENRQTMVSNVVDFVVDYNLDGVDFDWEYPDEPDIDGIPPGSENDSSGYYQLLKELKEAMPDGKTVSFTAPASFWYLQYFELELMSEVVDYIVFMTYDLHGQWDYGNAYADPGCDAGDCLRSHVNMTETLYALSMITKAGVPSNMIAVGVSSYGRSFEMTEAGCWTEMCTYTGPDSGATPGECTDTAGYIGDWEIAGIIVDDSTSEQYWDATSFSNILVYDSTQWVAWMNGTNKEVRTGLYQDFNFLGTADWAIDLGSIGDVSDENNGTFQCTSTYANSATVAWATATVLDNTMHCTGESTTLQAGKSILAQIAADSTIPVGSLTGDALYTSISSALAEGCTVADGETVTECNDIPKITGISYVKDIEPYDGAYVSTEDMETDGKIEIEVTVMKVWDQNVLDALISTIAATLQGLSMNSSNTIAVSHNCDSCFKNDEEDWPVLNYTSISGVVLAMYTEQTEETNGALELQDMEVTLSFDADEGDFQCAIGAFVLDAMSALSVIDGFEWLSDLTKVTTGTAMGMSLNCMLEDEISTKSATADVGGSGGSTATKASNTYTIAPNPDFPCSTTLANSAIVEYASSTITGGSTICTGSSSTVQAGKSILAQIANDATIPVGNLTGAPLFTSISSALAAGCTVETEGVTVTECSDIPKITGITIYDTEEDSSGDTEIVYGDNGLPYRDTAKIEMEVVLMRVWNQDVLNALISTIAATLQGMSVNVTNDIKAYDIDAFSWDDDDAPYYNYTSVSSNVLAIYTEQTEETDGSVWTQDLQIEFKIDGDSGEYHCGIGAFILDALATLAIIPGFEFLGPLAVDSTFGTSLACMSSELIGESDD